MKNMGRELDFDYEKHIWGKAGDVISLKDRRNPTLGLRRFLEIIDNTGGRLLEIGCGTGIFIRSVKYYRPDLEAYGCDISRTAIAAAKKTEEYDIHYEVADASSLPYKDESFDIVVMVDVLEHLEDIKEVLRETRRVLKEGGILHLLVPCEANRFTLHWLMWKLKIGHNLKREYAGHIQRLTTNDIHKFVGNQGLTIIKETFSFHFIGQIYDIFFDYLPRTFQRKKIIEYERKKICSVKDKISKSLKERGIILTLWAILGWLIEIVAFYESEILKSFPLAIGGHITCRKGEQIYRNLLEKKP